MEIGWWGGGQSGPRVSLDGDAPDADRPSADSLHADDHGVEHAPGDHGRGGGELISEHPGREEEAHEPPARDDDRPQATRDEPDEPDESGEPAERPVLQLRAGDYARGDARASSSQPDELAKVSYLPWAAPGIDVGSTTSEIESTAFRRPFVAPERGFEAAAYEAAGPPNFDEPGDWTAEYDDEEIEPDEPELDLDELDRALIKKLARRDLSTREVELFLEGNGLPPELLEEWVDRVVRLGYVDDVRLAENLVDQLRRRKGLGSSSIKQELAQRKIPPSVIAEALGDSDNNDERARAMELAAKRAGQLTSYDDATAERRLTGFLLRKGYASAVVRDAVKAALATRRRPSGGVRFR